MFLKARPQSLQELLENYFVRYVNQSFSQRYRVLVIGDSHCWTRSYTVMSERISPEAPVPVLKFDHKLEMLGGAGNVVANLAALGCKTTFIGIVGKDDSGKKISSLLKEAKANCHLLKLEKLPYHRKNPLRGKKQSSVSHGQ